MKVTFYSNFLTHHQVPFCEAMQKRLGENFKFVSTVKIFDWRLKLGFKDLDQEYNFVVRAYENENELKRAKQLALDSDVVIIGSTTDDCILERLKQDKLTFRYRSRILLFTDGVLKTLVNKEKIKLLYTKHLKYRKSKNLHLLCANAYGANDFGKLGLYKNKMYKWGYFLETNKYDIDQLIEEKDKNEKIRIIWVARFINWKHPEIVIKLANNLKKQGYNFEIEMLGAGKLEDKIKKSVKSKNLEDVIKITGQVPSEKVKEYMEKANIFIGTSDSNEGWGAVVNEAMNAGCAIVANQKMGSVPFLIKHKQNGMYYNTYKELENNVKELINNKQLRDSLGKNAYKFITEEWTGEIAAENILKLFETTINKKENEVKNGPASNASKYKKLTKI